MTDRKTRRAVTRLNSKYDPVFLAHAVGRQNAARTPWYRTPPAVPIAMTASRHPIGTFAGAKQAAFDAANRAVHAMVDADTETEHWADALLHRPVSSLNHRTVRTAGKPYHWRQDYTGQLKLAAGESPW
jgi:hypothetical protein